MLDLVRFELKKLLVRRTSLIACAGILVMLCGIMALNSTAQIFAIFGIMALIYFIVCFTLSQIVRAYQRRLKEARAA